MYTPYRFSSGFYLPHGTLPSVTVYSFFARFFAVHVTAFSDRLSVRFLSVGLGVLLGLLFIKVPYSCSGCSLEGLVLSSPGVADSHRLSTPRGAPAGAGGGVSSEKCGGLSSSLKSSVSLGCSVGSF